MHALLHTRLVKIAATGAKTNVAHANSANDSADEKTVGKRFLAIFLSCLSQWGT